MKYLFFSFVFIVSFVSCRKNINDNSYLLNFSINNAFILNHSDTFLLTNGYNSDSAENYLFQPSSNIFLNDGQIGDTLLISCGNWSYLQNPTATVEIWFPQGSIEDGIYEFSKTASVNDFEIVIKRNLILGPSFELGNQVSVNSIQNQELIAQGYTGFNNGSSYQVKQAFIKIDNAQSAASMIRYVIETENGELIKGSYSGNLEHFKRIHSEGDCD